MKSNVLLIAALITISAGMTAVAKEDPRNVRLAVVPVKGSEVFKIIYKGDSPARVRISIYNSSSQVVFSEAITSEGFIRPLNFSGLKAGEYTIELVEGKSRKVEKVMYTPVKEAVSGKVIHIAKVDEVEGKFLVSIANAVSEEITVRILDSNDNVIFSETRHINGDFAQVYRLKNAAGVKFEIHDAAGLNKLSRF